MIGKPIVKAHQKDEETNPQEAVPTLRQANATRISTQMLNMRIQESTDTDSSYWIEFMLLTGLHKLLSPKPELQPRMPFRLSR